MIATVSVAPTSHPSVGGVGTILGTGAWPALPVLSVDVALALAVLLLLAGVVGAVLPGVPGPLASLAGLYGVWWATGYVHPGGPLLVVLTGCGLAALLVDWVAGPVAARAGGASTRTVVIASAVGLVGLLGGPLLAVGLLVLTVFVLELDRSEDPASGLRTAGVTVFGILASVGVQVLLTGAILVGVLVSLAA